VTHLLLLILVLAAAGVYFMTASERTRLLRLIQTAFRSANDGAAVGLAVARDISARIPHRRRFAKASIVAVTLAALCAAIMPQAPMDETKMDVRPEIAERYLRSSGSSSPMPNSF
jgi:hypothetical protein